MHSENSTFRTLNRELVVLVKMCSGNCVSVLGHEKFVIVLFIVLCPLKFGFCAPDRLKREIIEDSVQSYLMKYGYLSSSIEGAGGALRTEESLRTAISDLQAFAGLPVTGHVDERTVKLLRTPRCGVQDKLPGARGRRKRFMLHEGKPWPYTNLTWSLRSRYIPNVDTYEARIIFAKALDVWAEHSKLTFTEVDSDSADILVYFHRGDHGDNFPFDGKGQVLAHAFFPGANRGGDAHFDMDEIWLTKETDSNGEGTNLFKVAAHEFGHSLGLSHSDVDGALMSPWYQGFQSTDYKLPEDDRLAIQALYGSNEEREWGRIPTYRPAPTTTTTTSTTTPRTRPTRPPQRPYYPDERYNPYHPYYPHKPYPEKPKAPEKPYTPHHPRKPMHPDKKHHPKYPEKPYSPNYPRDSDKYPGRYPTKSPEYPERRYPDWSPRRTPDRYPERTPERRPEITTVKTPIRHHPSYPDDSPKRKPPNTCDTSFDAVAVIRREVFFFKDTYFWRLGDNGLLPGYPAQIKRMWDFTRIVRNFTHVDAVYERSDNKIVFFIGKQFFVYTGNHLENGYPRPLTDLGLPASLERIDGATVWGHNGKTFFYSGDAYWRFDEEKKEVEKDYPRRMSMWKGVGSDIDAVFQWKDGKTYFFKGKGFWKFNDLHMRVEEKEQTPSGPFWMGCTHNFQSYQPNKERYTGEGAPSRSSSIVRTNTYLVIALGVILKLYRLAT